MLQSQKLKKKNFSLSSNEKPKLLPLNLYFTIYLIFIIFKSKIKNCFYTIFYFSYFMKLKFVKNNLMMFTIKEQHLLINVIQLLKQLKFIYEQCKINGIGY